MNGIGVARGLTPTEARTLAREAYVFGYPLVLMDVTREGATAVSHPDGCRAPMNQFAHVRTLADHTFTDGLNPCPDMLDTLAWIDVEREPIVLTVPDVGDRYYTMALLDGWTNVFASLGPRTTGSDRCAFAITSPWWTGTLPPEVTEIRSPTDMVWIIGRTEATGAGDCPAVNVIQDGYRLTPLSGWGRRYSAPEEPDFVPVSSAQMGPVEQVARMSEMAFFRRLNALMQRNPPAAADAPFVARLERIGVEGGAPFDGSGMRPSIVVSVEAGARDGAMEIVGAARRRSKPTSGWDTLTNLGRYGNNYRWRAAVALIGLGATLPEDAICRQAMRDADGRPLSGANQYRLHFPAGELPPVNGCWSLSMYDATQSFVKNPISRYAICGRDDLRRSADGSLTIYLQHGFPGRARESNWLPAPRDWFNVLLRMYWPRWEVVEGVWATPAVERVQ